MKDKFIFSAFVTYVLLIIGLTAEYFGINLIVRNIDMDSRNLLLTRISIVMLLIHQFFIIRNFHIIDHVDPNDYSKYSFGDWVSKSRVEDILRFILFMFFAGLTGEIIYLLLIGTTAGIIDFSWLIKSNEDGYFDLSWITRFYLWCAIVMMAIMFAWDLIGIIYDRQYKKFGLRKFDPNDRIVYFPFNNSYYTFIISDLLSLLYWVFIFNIVVLEAKAKDVTFWIILFFSLFLTIILTRLIGEIGVNIPRIRKLINEYKGQTKW